MIKSPILNQNTPFSLTKKKELRMNTK